MKTYSFLSYKGGQGRTMALANIASCLARLGYGVVALDLDMDAPGLPSKFGIPVFGDEELLGNKGVLPYFTALADPKNIKQPSVADYLVPIEGVENGRLLLMPTGRVCGGAYWSHLASETWRHELRSFFDPVAPINYFELLLKGIAEMEPAPDYLLIDNRCGFTEVTALGAMLLPQKTVCLFGNDPENTAGMKFVLDRMEAIYSHAPGRTGFPCPKLPPDQTRAILVLSRVPLFVPDEEKNSTIAELGEYFKLKDRPICEKKILSIHSDPEIEARFRLRIPVSGELTYTKLVDDYIVLLLALDPDICAEQGVVGESLNFVRQKLGFPDRPKSYSESHKMFRLSASKGVMINLADNSRNVAFKVETFCSMLKEIHKGIMLELLGQNNDSPALTSKVASTIDEKFTEAGKECGTAFGRSLMNEYWEVASLPSEVASLPSEVERIHEWCSFDSEVGFGRLSLGEDIETEDGRVVRGEVSVIDNFLASDTKTGSPNLCALMKGYVQGALEEILGRKGKLQVLHPEEVCMRVNAKRESCLFRFALTE